MSKEINDASCKYPVDPVICTWYIKEETQRRKDCKSIDTEEI